VGMSDLPPSHYADCHADCHADCLPHQVCPISLRATMLIAC
jgi:hypothetical protein